MFLGATWIYFKGVVKGVGYFMQSLIYNLPSVSIVNFLLFAEKVEKRGEMKNKSKG